MIVELVRTSQIFGETHPDKIAKPATGYYVTHRCTCRTLEDVKKHPAANGWFFREGTINHRKEGGGTAMDAPAGDNLWVADVPSLEWAAEKWGTIVVEGSNIVGVKWRVEIYDGYRE